MRRSKRVQSFDESDSMQEARGAGVLTVTTPGERHRTAPARAQHHPAPSTALAIAVFAHIDWPRAIPPCCDLPPAMPTLLSADPCVWMLPRQVNYRPLQGVPASSGKTVSLHDEMGEARRCSWLGLVNSLIETHWAFEDQAVAVLRCPAHPNPPYLTPPALVSPPPCVLSPPDHA